MEDTFSGLCWRLFEIKNGGGFFSEDFQIVQIIDERGRRDGGRIGHHFSKSGKTRVWWPWNTRLQYFQGRTIVNGTDAIFSDYGQGKFKQPIY